MGFAPPLASPTQNIPLDAVCFKNTAATRQRKKSERVVPDFDVGKKRLNVKLTQAEHEDVLRLKSDFGITVSDMVRRALSDHVQQKYGSSIKAKNRPVDTKKKPVIKYVAADPELVRNIALIGNNLNQIATWVNTYKSEIDAVKVNAALLQIRKAFDLILEGKLDA